MATVHQDTLTPVLIPALSPQRTDDNLLYAQTNAIPLSACNTADPHVSCPPGSQKQRRSVPSMPKKFLSAFGNCNSYGKCSSTTSTQINIVCFQNQNYAPPLPGSAPLPTEPSNQCLPKYMAHVSGHLSGSNSLDRDDVPSSPIKRANHRTKIHTLKSRD